MNNGVRLRHQVVQPNAKRPESYPAVAETPCARATLNRLG